jgi:hypothetical protein
MTGSIHRRDLKSVEPAKGSTFDQMEPFSCCAPLDGPLSHTVEKRTRRKSQGDSRGDDSDGAAIGTPHCRVPGAAL